MEGNVLIEEVRREVEDSGGSETTLELRFGMFNCSGLSGKIEAIEREIQSLGLDFVFLSETWTTPGQATRLSENIFHAQEHARMEGVGRAHYGQALLLNPTRLQPHEIALIQEDLSEDKCYMVIRIRGIIFCLVYLSPSGSVAWMESKLTELQDWTCRDCPAVIMGDLNARHPALGDITNNDFGSRLVGLLDELGVERTKPAEERWTFQSVVGRSIVDHVLGNQEAVGRGLQCEVMLEPVAVGSDHRFICGSILADAPNSAPICAVPKPWNRWRLRDPHIKEELRQLLWSRYAQVEETLQFLEESPELSDQEKADQMDQTISDWLDFGLRKAVGHSNRKGRLTGEFLTHELLSIEAVLRHKQLEVLALPAGSVDYRTAWEEFHRCRQHWERQLSRRREELFRSFADELQLMAPRAQFRVINAIKRSKTRSKGSVLKSDPDSLAGYATFYAGQYRNNQPRLEGPEVEVTPVPAGEDGPIHSPFSAETILYHLEKLPEGKATGNSGIPCEALSAVAEVISQPVSRLFDFCWRTSVVPVSWRRARIQPVPKKGDLTRIENNRPISLTEILRKTFEGILLPWITRSIEPLSVEQGGFRAKRGTLDQIATLQEWIQQAKAKKKPRFMAFLDIKAAYDQVDRSILWSKCRLKGMDEQLIRVLQALFDGNAATVAVNGHMSEEFALESGVLQGSPLSPVLYSLFIDDLVEWINERGPGRGPVTLGGRYFRCLLYADDIVLLSTCWKELQWMLETCERHSIKNRYRFGVSKCEAVLSEEPAPRMGGLTIYGQELPRSSSFTYLGMPITAKGIAWKDHLIRMGVRALKAASFFRAAGCNGNGFDTATSLRIYGCFVRPIVEYGIALCPMAMQTLLDGYYSKCIRLMTSCGKTASHVTVGMFGEIHPAKVRITTLQFRFAEKSRKKDDRFAVKSALKAFDFKKTSKSCFASWEENPFWLKTNRCRNTASHLGQKPELPRLHDMQDELLESILQSLKSAFIFRGKTRETRKTFRRHFSRIPRQDQRLIFNWVLNRNVGRWKQCQHCHGNGADKAHLERCALGLVPDEDEREAPSLTELYLCKAKYALRFLGFVEHIRRMVGDLRYVQHEPP